MSVTTTTINKTPVNPVKAVRSEIEYKINDLTDRVKSWDCCQSQQVNIDKYLH
jgi:hypothetical protein